MEDETYRVILHRIGENTEEEKTRFCGEVSETYGIPLPLMKKMVERCPIVVKKNLPFKKAEMLAIAFRSSGASASVEKKRSLSPVSVESIGEKPYRLRLESSSLRKSPGGAWQVFGRVQNIYKEELRDVWALIQVFDEYGELTGLEEIPLPINPLPPNYSSPFKALFEKDLSIQNVSIAFKTASGSPIPAMDQRERREWVEVKIAEPQRRDPPLSPIEISEDVLSPLEPSLTLAPEMKEGDLDRQEMERVPSEMPPHLAVEIPALFDENLKRSGEGGGLTFFESEGQRFAKDEEEQRGVEIEEEGPSRDVTQTLVVKESLEEEELHLDVSKHEPVENASQRETTLLLFEKEESVTEEKVAPAAHKVDEKPIFYPWLNDFKRAIEAYDQSHKEPFLLWFENLQKEGRLADPYYSLLTLLIYARFNQTPSWEIALENTQKVFPLMIQADLSPEQIPPLRGDLFFPPDIWRDLYLRAIPKLQEVSRRILKETRWATSDLDRLIRIIPHMTARNSRWVIRVLHHWIPEVVPDISEMEIDINDGVYRLASRLGVVNPSFDYYQGKNSMGDLKIQSFARAAFPEDPGKIEEPMSRLGANDEEGYCLPTRPKCQSCPLESFCQKHFIDFNPSEKGMMLRSW